jgi:regulator of protease activity HflC (stomatin/prohibitin superfamily)
VTEEAIPAPSEAQPATDPDAPEPIAQPYVQITETVATPNDAAIALEKRDPYGRVPVVVRIQRQPPIKIEWILLAIGLGASGLFLPLFAALRAVLIVAAIAAVIVGLLSRIFIRIPPGSVGLVVKAGRHERVLTDGIHRVSPVLALTHLVTTREIAFDVPVNEVRSSDGIAVKVDLLLTLAVSDPARLAYSITSGDLDQIVHAATQDAVRTLIRGVESLAALDLGADEAARLRERIDARLSAYGVEARNAAFTRVVLPEPLMASIEARRLAAVQLVEEEQNFALDQRRISDRASLIAQEAEARRTTVEHEATVEAIRLEKLQERIAANPAAARYDLETRRLDVARAVAGNSRAVVSLGGGDLVADLLAAREVAGDDPVAPVAATPPTATPSPEPAAEPAVATPPTRRAVASRSRNRT